MNADDPTGLFGSSQLDSTLPTPLYHQIYLVIREKIRSGAFASASIMPGEQELAQQFKVSRITVKRALNELAADGLVTRHRGRGTIVAAGSFLPVITASFDTLIESFRLMGLGTEMELLEVAEIAADATIARHLTLDIGAPVQRAVRRRKIEGEPFSHLVSFVPAAIAACYTIEELSVTPLLVLLDKAGAAPKEAEQWITAVAADALVAAALGVSVSAPLLKIERVMRSAKGVPVELIYGHYRPDRFNYHVRTQRQRTGSGTTDGWRVES